ncbi:MAG: hypothetical protein ACFUZC_03265 [Chthoniobacteraceae bacterium]
MYPTENTRHYRQAIPLGNGLLNISSFDYLIFTVLEITGISPAEIQAVHVDAAFPLRIALKETPEMVHVADYPLRLAPGESATFMLHTTSTSPILQRFCYPTRPEKVIVTTRAGLLIFIAE